MLTTTAYRAPDYYFGPYGPGTTTIARPVMVSPAIAAITPAITINLPAPPTPVTPVQSGAPAAVAAQEGWFEQETSGISNKLLAAGAVVAALIYFSSRKK